VIDCVLLVCVWINCVLLDCGVRFSCDCVLLRYVVMFCCDCVLLIYVLCSVTLYSLSLRFFRFVLCYIFC